MLDAKTLKEHAHYCPETGVFTRLKSNSPRFKNTLDTRLGKQPTASGYMYACIAGHNVALHRTAWLYMTGEWPPAGQLVDHVNRDTYDNRWENLRLLSRAGNVRNQSQRGKSTKSGLTGVYFKEGQANKKKPWVASLRINGKLKHLGHFATSEEAVAAREKEHRAQLQLEAEASANHNLEKL